MVWLPVRVAAHWFFHRSAESRRSGGVPAKLISMAHSQGVSVGRPQRRGALVTHRAQLLNGLRRSRITPAIPILCASRRC